MKMNSAILICPLIIPALLAFGSCNIINPAEDIPSYIRVDSIAVFTDEATQGSASSNISDFWVTVDGEFLSGYQLGTKVPVLYDGLHTVSLRAGILLNGIGGTRVPYAVFGTFDTLVDLKPGFIHNIVPRVTYSGSTTFLLNENFDNNSLLFSTPVTSAPILVEPNVYDGNCGKVVLNALTTSLECTTIDSFDLPGATIPTYLEIDYLCDTEFSVGVKASTSLGPLSYPLLSVRATSTWKKIYVNLTPITTQAQGARDWKIFITASLGLNEVSDTLRFDNIKLVY